MAYRHTHAEELAATWINGNRTDVRASLEELTPLHAARLAVEILAELEYAAFETARDFRKALERWADDEPDR